MVVVIVVVVVVVVVVGVVVVVFGPFSVSINFVSSENLRIGLHHEQVATASMAAAAAEAVISFRCNCIFPPNQHSYLTCRHGSRRWHRRRRRRRYCNIESALV